MIVEFIEDPDGFWLELRSETMEEATNLVRYGINKTKKIKYNEVFALENGSVVINMVLGKRKDYRYNVGFPKRS